MLIEHPRIILPLLPPCSYHTHSKPHTHTHTHTGLFGNVVPFNLPDVGEAIITVEVKEWCVRCPAACECVTSSSLWLHLLTVLSIPVHTYM